MATKKTRKRKPARKAARRPARKAARKTTRKATRKGATRRAAPKKTSAKKTPSPAVRKVRPGFISHTELASADPVATKQWCQEVLGWKFGASMPTPGGDYHMWSFGDNMGGGIRNNNPPETPGTIPYCEVKNIRATFASALKAGAIEMMPPTEIPGAGGSIAIVQVPGGVAIGFWGTK
jgi:predicted enzyme related to lactoylglutathione lyase